MDSFLELQRGPSTSILAGEVEIDQSMPILRVVSIPLAQGYLQASIGILKELLVPHTWYSKGPTALVVALLDTTWEGV